MLRPRRLQGDQTKSTGLFYQLVFNYQCNDLIIKNAHKTRRNKILTSNNSCCGIRKKYLHYALIGFAITHWCLLWWNSLPLLPSSNKVGVGGVGGCWVWLVMFVFNYCTQRLSEPVGEKINRPISGKIKAFFPFIY